MFASLTLPELQVLLSARNCTPFGHAHLCFPPGTKKQRWLQLPLFIRHGVLPNGTALRKKISRKFTNCHLLFYEKETKLLLFIKAMSTPFPLQKKTRDVLDDSLSEEKKLNERRSLELIIKKLYF